MTTNEETNVNETNTEETEVDDLSWLTVEFDGIDKYNEALVFAINRQTNGVGEYLVCTDEKANERARTSIEDSLWAFNTEFIFDNSNIEDYDKRTIEAFKKMQGEMCESANPIVKALIKDMDEFVEAAIDADGRGHFMSSYNGEELEMKIGDVYYYAYRTN